MARFYSSIWLLALLVLLLFGSCGGNNEYGEIYKVIRKNGKYGYINQNGDIAIQPQFAYAIEFSEGLGGVNIGGKPRGDDMPIDGKWGFVDRQGRFVINPQFYSPEEMGAPYDPTQLARVQHEGYVFSEGLAAVRLEKEWVFIDTIGQIQIRNPRIQSARRFEEGLANVYIEGLWGYMDHQGELVIPPRFLYPIDFRNGMAVVMDEKGQKVLIDRKGKRHLPQYKLETQFYEGVAVIKAGFKGEPLTEAQKRMYSLVDTAGRLLFEPQFDRLGRFGSGMCPALVGSRAGDPLMHPEPVQPTESPGGKWGFVNMYGEFVLNPVFEDARGFSEGIAAVKGGGLWGFMDTNGSMITGFEFRWVDYFYRGMAVVQLGPLHNDYDGKFAYVDQDGEVLWITH
ncbi:MAG: WG repeat-containing protein [Bacteroidota bacterium]